MPTLNLSCACGATLSYTGSDGYAQARHRDFDDTHKGHEAAAVAAQVEQLATASALDVATVADLVKAITTQIDAATQPRRICEDRAAPKRGTHLDVELQPGETITIRGREHPNRPVIVLHGRLVTDDRTVGDDGLLPTHLRLDDAYPVAWRKDV